MLFWLILGTFWCSVVKSVTLSSNLSNFLKKVKKNRKKIKKSQIRKRKEKNQN